MYPTASHARGQREDVEFTLTRSDLNDAAKHRCYHHNAANRIEIPLKARSHVIPESKFMVENTNECALVQNTTAVVLEAMVLELIVHAAANIVEMFVQALVTLQKTPFLDSRILYGTLRS